MKANSTCPPTRYIVKEMSDNCDNMRDLNSIVQHGIVNEMSDNCNNIRDLNSIVQICSENFSLLSEPYTGTSISQIKNKNSRNTKFI
jgi:hypothetical protein